MERTIGQQHHVRGPTFESILVGDLPPDQHTNLNLEIGRNAGERIRARSGGSGIWLRSAPREEHRDAEKGGQTPTVPRGDAPTGDVASLHDESLPARQEIRRNRQAGGPRRGARPATLSLR
jgi:hypothetical protein